MVDIIEYHIVWYHMQGFYLSIDVRAWTQLVLFILFLIALRLIYGIPKCIIAQTLLVVIVILGF